MRTEVIDYINTLPLGGFLLTQELPWTQDGAPLYLKNLKKIYVGVMERTQDTIVSTLNGLYISADINTVSIYFACDAKQLPSNYDTLIDDLSGVKGITTIDGVYRRDIEISTSMESDLLVTQLQVRFTKLST